MQIIKKYSHIIDVYVFSQNFVIGLCPRHPALRRHKYRVRRQEQNRERGDGEEAGSLCADGDRKSVV